jgi:hypothetical protein
MPVRVLVPSLLVHVLLFIISFLYIFACTAKIYKNEIINNKCIMQNEKRGKAAQTHVKAS